MTIDRRKFLAGTALGAVTAVFLDKQEAKAGNVSGYKARFAMIFDQNKCVGCGACKEACSETNHVPAGQLRMTLERQSPLDGTPGNRKYVRVSCQQCSEPPCVRVCPTGAAHIDPATNIVTMDNSRCVGCKYCIAGCPYNVRDIRSDKTYSGVLKKKATIESVLKSLQNSIPIEYKIVGNNIFISSDKK